MSLPFDKAEYLRRQELVFSQLPESSLVIIPTNDRKIRSNDVSYPFRANSYMLYICGWEEDEGTLLATNSSGKWETTLFVPDRDTTKEIWEGIRIGVDGAKSWPVTHTESLEGLDSCIKGLVSEVSMIFTIPGVSSSLDNILLGNTETNDLRPHIDPIRRIKSENEIEYMQKAALIASKAHEKAMRNSRPDIGEWEIQSVVEGHFLSSLSQWSFPSIVGGGDNATVLHYKNNNQVIKSGDLVLVDAGCEVSGYASDITRTWPVNGKFTQPQKEIYELVLKAELAGIEACQPGAPWVSMHESVCETIAEGLIELGILSCTYEEALGRVVGKPGSFQGQIRNFFMHGTGHFLGLDVHDVGGGRQGDSDSSFLLEPGMVLTIEPGLYFGSWRNDISIPERYSGIGIRIEDDVLVTEQGPLVLSSCPKMLDEIEEIVGKRIHD
jgi:Xaa-Pro aminopeptidase